MRLVGVSVPIGNDADDKVRILTHDGTIRFICIGFLSVTPNAFPSRFPGPIQLCLFARKNGLHDRRPKEGKTAINRFTGFSF